MMQIVYFSRKEQFLNEIQKISEEKVFVAPSPAKADGLRLLLKDTTSYDVITIAKFTSELVKNLWDDDEVKNVKRKAELLLIFGVLKNKYLPELNFVQFSQAYNLFSDLRSFTLNQEVLSSVMEEQPREVQDAVKLFWQLLEVTGYLDEHGATQKLTESLRSAEEISELKKTYIFWGFQHLNGQQVDLIKALSIRYQVIIPFPLALKDKLKRSDWLNWLKDDRTIEKELEEVVSIANGKWIKVNSRELALNLKSIIKKDDQIIMGVSKLSPLHLDFIPSKLTAFKIPVQLLNAELQLMAEEIKNNLGQLRKIDELILFLENKRKAVITKLSVKASYKELRAVELYQEALNSIKVLTDDEIDVNLFFLKLLEEVVTLNQPRTSFIPNSMNELSIDIRDMSSLEHIRRNRRVIICIDERFDEILSLGQTYPETIRSHLSVLGPIKRNDLELSFKHWEFLDIFAYCEVIVLMSETTLKHNLVWKKLFTGIELKAEVISNKFREKELSDHFKKMIVKPFDGSFSASKFQSYTDCPRKFYFSYVDKIFPSVSLENDLDSLTTGSISHKIIEEYFKTSSSLAELSTLTQRVMSDYINEKKLNLPKEKLLKHEIIFNHRALNGINFLKKIEELLNVKIDWKIESEFSLSNPAKINGKIDCIGTFENITFLLDFKSTKYAASSFKEIENFESLQLWTYAIAASHFDELLPSRSVIMGYVSLDNPTESNLMFSDNELADKFQRFKICKIQVFKTPFPELFSISKMKMLELSMAIQNEKIFAPLPRKSSTCQFCELTKVCMKSELVHE